MSQEPQTGHVRGTIKSQLLTISLVLATIVIYIAWGDMLGMNLAHLLFIFMPSAWVIGIHLDDPSTRTTTLKGVIAWIACLFIILAFSVALADLLKFIGVR